MNRQNKIVLITSILLVVGYFTLDFLCKVGVKCKNCPQSSISIEDSRNSGFFIAEYVPTREFVSLKNYDDSIQFEKAWVESSWIVNSDICLIKIKEKSNGYNITVEFNKKTDDFIFDLQGYGSSYGMGVNSKIVSTQSLNDTLVFRIKERNPDPNIGWKDDWNGEEIKFVRLN